MRAPAIKAVRGTVAIKGGFPISTVKRSGRSSYGGVRSPYEAIGSSFVEFC